MKAAQVQPLKTAMAGIVALLTAAAITGVAGTVPFTESFESYAPGAVITNVSLDWSSISTNGGGLISQDATAIAALDAFTNAGNAFPLPAATHTKVLRVIGPLAETATRTPAGAAFIDFMIMPSIGSDAPRGDVNHQVAFYLDTNNQKLAIWHQDRTILPYSNTWLTLAASTPVPTDQWTRVSIVEDFVHHMYQISTNQSAPISDAAGWTQNGGSQPGSWFFMVQTNSALSRLRVQEDSGEYSGTNTASFLDDLSYTNRSISYSAVALHEGAANDGSISDSITITVQGDTFTNIATLLTNVHYTISGVPAGLLSSLTYSNATQLTLTLAGNAANHGVSDSTNMTLILRDAAFTIGAASDIPGYSNTVTVLFTDPTALTYSPYGPSGRPTFTEAMANDGSIGNDINIALHGDTFTNIATLVENTHYQVIAVPDGLTFSLTRVNETNLTAHLGGNATAHASGDSVPFPVIIFLNDAFDNSEAASVIDSSMNLQTDFANAPEVTYTLTTYPESAANDGSVNGSTIGILAGQFTSDGSPVENFVTNNKVLVSNYSPGLTPVITRTGTDLTHLTVSFSGKATNHANSNDVYNLTFAFQNSAFPGGNAGDIVNSLNNMLSIDFRDPPVLSIDTNTFNEQPANDGVISNNIVITLLGEDFKTGGFTNGIQYSVPLASIPLGLTFEMTRLNSTQLQARLTGTATAPHGTAQNTTPTLTFSNSAFAYVAASNVNGSTQNLNVHFLDQPELTCADNVFHEAAINNGSMANSVVFTLARDTFKPGLYTNGTHYNVSVPTGLIPVLTRDNANQVTLSLTANATPPHGSAQNVNPVLTFATPIFTTVASNNVFGSTTNVSVPFLNPPGLSFSRTKFSEWLNGTIVNDPITITLSGDSFVGGNDFVAEGKIVPLGLPLNLTAVVTRVSGTVLSAKLTGAALNNGEINDTTFALQLQNSALTTVQADQVTGYQQPISLDFNDISGIPYGEPFEIYTNSYVMVGTKYWQSIAADAGIVTNDPNVIGALLGYGTNFPMYTTHAKVLRTTDDITEEIRSASERTLYSDFMLYMTPPATAPVGSTNYQVALYVNTNKQLVVWHRNVSIPANEWRVMSGSPLVETGAWHRVTVQQDYDHQMFQIRIDQSRPIIDTAGWSTPVGGTHPGTWFYMVNTNGYLSRVRTQGGTYTVSTYLDDLTVSTAPPDFFEWLRTSLIRFW